MAYVAGNDVRMCHRRLSENRIIKSASQYINANPPGVDVFQKSCWSPCAIMRSYDLTIWLGSVVDQHDFIGLAALYKEHIT